MIIKFIKYGLDLQSGHHPHFVREATSYDCYAVNITTEELKNSVDLVGAVRDYAYQDGHDLEDVRFCISENARMRADDGGLQKQIAHTLMVFELSDGIVVYTDLPVYVCNDAGKTIDSYNTG